eukprot:9108072-Pyramimonas_sp.AAC.1
MHTSRGRRAQLVLLSISPTGPRLLLCPDNPPVLYASADIPVCVRVYMCVWRVPGGVLFGVSFRSLTATPVYHVLSRQEEPVHPAWVQGRLAGPQAPSVGPEQAR